MCDRIQDLNNSGSRGEESYDAEQLAASKLKMATAQTMLAKSGCADINALLDQCLDKNNREWRFC